jgi:hypothetical protein
MVLAYWMRLAMLGVFLGVLFLVPGRGGQRTGPQRLPLWFRALVSAFVLIAAVGLPSRYLGFLLLDTYPQTPWVAPLILWVALVIAYVWSDRRWDRNRAP